MLTAESLVAKVVTLIAQKSLNAIGSLAFDKRKRACRALTKLYYCVQALDDVTEKVKKTFGDFSASGTPKAESLVHALNNHMYEVSLATNMFIDLGQELHAGLDIIDPALAECCHLLYVSKGDFLHFMSNCVRWERGGLRPAIVLKRPSRRIEEVDLETLHAETRAALERGEKHYWPESAFDEFDAEFTEVSISFEDEGVAQDIYQMLCRHSDLLKQAKNQLRELLRTKFSIEEVLFQSDSHPYR